MNRSFLFFITFGLLVGTSARVETMESAQSFMVKIPLDSHPYSHGILNFEHPSAVKAHDLFSTQIESHSLLSLVDLFVQILCLNKDHCVNKGSEILHTLVRVFFNALIFKSKLWSDALKVFQSSYSSLQHYQKPFEMLSEDLTRNVSGLVFDIHQFFSGSSKENCCISLIATVFAFLESIPSFYLFFHSYELKNMLSQEHKIIRNLLKEHYERKYSKGFPYMKGIDSTSFAAVECYISELRSASAHPKANSGILSLDDTALFSMDYTFEETFPPFQNPSEAFKVRTLETYNDERIVGVPENTEEIALDRGLLNPISEPSLKQTSTREHLDLEQQSPKKRKTSLSESSEKPFAMKLMALELSNLLSELDANVKKEVVQKDLIERLSQEQLSFLQTFLTQYKDTLSREVIEFIGQKLCCAHQEQKEFFFEIISQEGISFPLLSDIINSFSRT